MKRYLLNSPVLTDFGLWRFDGPLSAEAAARWAQEGFVSAIGHEGTAALLGNLLGRPVAANRQRAVLELGDEALVFRLLERLPEGIVLGQADLGALRWQLGILTRLA
jgi:hypothetical protein